MGHANEFDGILKNYFALLANAWRAPLWIKKKIIFYFIRFRCNILQGDIRIMIDAFYLEQNFKKMNKDLCM